MQLLKKIPKPSKSDMPDIQIWLDQRGNNLQQKEEINKDKDSKY